MIAISLNCCFFVTINETFQNSYFDEINSLGGGCNPRSTNSCQNMKDNSFSNDSKSDSKTEVRLEMQSE